MLGGEAGAPPQREPQPHAERGRACPAACAAPLRAAEEPALPTAPGGPAGAIPLPAAAGAVRRELREAG